jgi:uncharacterized membrane protein
VIADVAPSPSDRANGSVTWVGREDFADERPRVVFVTAQDQATGDGATTPNPSPSSAAGNDRLGILLSVGLLAILIGVALYVGYRRRSESGDQSDLSADKPLQAGDTAVLTDEERVIRHLEERDGRVRQADIAEAFDWSASKTSRDIGSMVEAGEIEKLQLGRENLIDLVDGDSE